MITKEHACELAKEATIQAKSKDELFSLTELLAALHPEWIWGIEHKAEVVIGKAKSQRYIDLMEYYRFHSDAEQIVQAEMCRNVSRVK